MRRALGLRARLLLALLAVAATTLGVAALALFSPLTDRLAENAADAVRQAALATRPQLEDDLRADGGIGADTIDTAVRLADRTNSRVQLFDVVPNVVERFDTEFGDAREDDIYRSYIQDGRTVESERDGLVRIAVPLRVRGEFVAVLAVRKRERDSDDAAEVVREAFGTAAIVSLAVAALVGLALAATLSRRLERLRQSALRLADEGPDAPAPVDLGRDEVGDLSRAFAAMRVALRRQEEARRAFVATASHELRTPLTSLSGNLELLAEDLESGRVDLEDAREQIAGAQGQLGRLRLLATELLELSRLDAGVELRPEALELSELCRAVAAEFALRASDEGIALDIGTPIAPVWAQADPGAAARVVRILLDNALRFAPEGTTIRLVPAYHGEHATVEVADEGPGVPEEEREAVFERFRRGSRTGGEGGFGLGLAIGRELAERMDGGLDLAPGEAPGARFVLRLPLDRPA